MEEEEEEEDGNNFFYIIDFTVKALNIIRILTQCLLDPANGMHWMGTTAGARAKYTRLLLSTQTNQKYPVFKFDV